jgi:thiol-disulfide isomerase/thioredoxin
MWLRFFVLSMVAATGLSCAGKSPKDARPAAVEDYRKIPLIAVGGGAHTLGELLGRRPALLSLWAPWCEPCVKELPELERLAQAVGPCGAAVLGIAVGESPGAVAAFVRAHQLTYPQYTDEQFKLADALGQRRVPANIVLDSDQQVVYAGSALDGRATDALATAMADAAGGAPCPTNGAAP